MSNTTNDDNSNNVFDAIHGDRQQQRRDATAEYYRVLARFDAVSPSAADLKMLQRLADVLGKDMGQVAADHREVMAAVALRQDLDDTVDAVEQLTAANLDHESACLRRQRAYAEANEWVRQAAVQQQICEGEVDRRRTATLALQSLRQSSPMIYAAVMAVAS